MTQEKKKKKEKSRLGIPGTGLAESLMSEVDPQILPPAALLRITGNTMSLKQKRRG